MHWGLASHLRHALTYREHDQRDGLCWTIVRGSVLTSPVSSATPTQEQVDELKDRAAKLLPILRRQARRPYFVELAGTPKAGKTTTLQVLRSFLKECGYQVDEMRERAADCPVAPKGHFFFNTWTTTTMLASMIENLESDADVVLLDRGVFDAIVWLQCQLRDQQVTPEEYNIFRQFVLLERWRKLTDLTVILKVGPEIADSRENQALLIRRSGTIMNPATLRRYNDVLDQVRNDIEREYKDFRIIGVDTTNYKSAKETTFAVISQLVEQLSDWANPEIAVLPRKVLEDVMRGEKIQELEQVKGAVMSAIEYHRRSSLQENGEYVGLVAAGVLRRGYEGAMLLLERSGESEVKRERYGRYLLWKGCHLAKSALVHGDIFQHAAYALQGRLKEDFHLAQLEPTTPPRYLVWNKSNPTDAMHAGIFFSLEIPTDEVAQSIARKMFKKERSSDRTTLRGREFITAADLQKRVDDNLVELESWSTAVLNHMARGK